MFQVLLVAFLFLPGSQIGTIKKPFATIEQCQAAAVELAKKATANEVPIVGTCVTPKDYVGV